MLEQHVGLRTSVIPAWRLQAYHASAWEASPALQTVCHCHRRSGCRDYLSHACSLWQVSGIVRSGHVQCRKRAA